MEKFLKQFKQHKKPSTTVTIITYGLLLLVLWTVDTLLADKISDNWFIQTGIIALIGMLAYPFISWAACKIGALVEKK